MHLCCHVCFCRTVHRPAPHRLIGRPIYQQDVRVLFEVESDPTVGPLATTFTLTSNSTVDNTTGNNEDTIDLTVDRRADLKISVYVFTFIVREGIRYGCPLGPCALPNRATSHFQIVLLPNCTTSKLCHLKLVKFGSGTILK